MEIARARAEDIPFVAWATLTADRSHLPRGGPEIYLGGSEADALAFISARAAIGGSPFHYANFLVARVRGEAVSALCGFTMRDYSPATLSEIFDQVNRQLGRSDADHLAGMRRTESWGLVAPEHREDAWIIECVATRPEFRRRGLTEELLRAVLEAGRSRGFSVAEIAVFIGNDAAQRAYEKIGFQVVSEKRHPDFEAAFMCPGQRLLRRML